MKQPKSVAGLKLIIEADTVIIDLFTEVSKQYGKKSM